jgi:hypothetical protein
MVMSDAAPDASILIAGKLPGSVRNVIAKELPAVEQIALVPDTVTSSIPSKASRAVSTSDAVAECASAVVYWFRRASLKDPEQEEPQMQLTAWISSRLLVVDIGSSPLGHSNNEQS